MSNNPSTTLTVTLQSQGLMSISKLLSWAIKGYRDAQHNDQPVGVFIALLSDGYGLSPVLAEKVLRGDVLYSQDDQHVVLLLDQMEADIYTHRLAAIKGRDIPRQVMTAAVSSQH